MKKLLSLILAVCYLGLLPHVTADMVPLTVSMSFQRTDDKAANARDADAEVLGDAVIFVIDHSGSMGTNDATVDLELAPAYAGRKMTRWDALKVSLRATLAQIKPGSIVQIIKVGGEERTSWHGRWIETNEAKLTTGNGYVIKTPADRDRLYDNVDKWGKPIGGTPLYHGLFLACQQARRFTRENRNAKVIVFSDGKDECHNSKIRRKEDLDQFKPLFEAYEFNALLNWVGNEPEPSKPFGPKFGWVRSKKDNLIPVICDVQPAAAQVFLKNPMATGNVRIAAPYGFSLSQRHWGDLLAGGIDVTVGLRTPNGEDVGGENVHFAAGATSHEGVFPIDDSYFTGGKGATFELTLALPAEINGCRFMQPRPVRISFEQQGMVTLASVIPGSGFVAKVGEPVSFAASGTEGASYKWAFGDGTDAEGARVAHAFKAPAPKGVSFSVSAEKAGLVPASHSGTIIVVEAGVDMGAIPAGLKVGDTAVLTCRGRGEFAAYDWFIDGAPVVG